jgi:hypothetical protein
VGFRDGFVGAVGVGRGGHRCAADPVEHRGIADIATVRVAGTDHMALIADVTIRT